MRFSILVIVGLLASGSALGAEKKQCEIRVGMSVSQVKAAADCVCFGNFYIDLKDGTETFVYQCETHVHTGWELVFLRDTLAVIWVRDEGLLSARVNKIS